MKQTILFYILFVMSFSYIQASQVDTLLTQSKVMNKQIKAVVVLPDSYDGIKNYPVIYTLHGHSGNYTDWVKKAPDFKELADKYQVILVCPDGKNSWYWDSPLNPDSQYETYIAKELITQIDGVYKTVQSPKGRGITGLSMGGHGALYLAIRHQDVFGVAGSMSGGVNILPFSENWEINRLLGGYAQNKQVWEKHTVINMIDQIIPGSLPIIFDCGTDDFFYDVNVGFHEKLSKNKISHEFISRPGGHTWEYWRNSIPHHAAFMHTFFNENNVVPENHTYFFDEEAILKGTLNKLLYTNLADQSFYTYVLELEHPITVFLANDEERTVHDIKEIQVNLIWDEAEEKQYIGKTITVKGIIYPETTVHDRRPVVMVVPEIISD